MVLLPAFLDPPLAGGFCVSWYLIEALGLLEAAEAEPLLQPLVDHPDIDVRKSAIATLKRITTQGPLEIHECTAFESGGADPGGVFRKGGLPGRPLSRYTSGLGSTAKGTSFVHHSRSPTSESSSVVCQNSDQYGNFRSRMDRM